MIDRRQKRRCGTCRAIFNFADDPEGVEQIDCMRCCGLSPADVREYQRLRDPERYERTVEPRTFFLNETHEI